MRDEAIWRTLSIVKCKCAGRWYTLFDKHQIDRIYIYIYIEGIRALDLWRRLCRWCVFKIDPAVPLKTVKLTAVTPWIDVRRPSTSASAALRTCIQIYCPVFMTGRSIGVNSIYAIFLYQSLIKHTTLPLLITDHHRHTNLTITQSIES